MVGCGRGSISSVERHRGDCLQDESVVGRKRVVVFRARGSHGKKETDKRNEEKA
jgi:hypothetical protein